MADLEKMKVRDLIISFLTNEKDNAAHKNEIIEYVRKTQPKAVERGGRTPYGISSILSQLKREGILSNEGLERGHWGLKKKDVQLSAQFWKVAPGENAWNWDACLQGKYIALGWDEIGDVSGLSQEEFNNRQEEVRKQHPDWTKTALDQVWKFAHIPEGSIIVANRGTTEVLGFGTVAGKYYFVSGQRHGHRLPVDWYDTDLRRVNEPGWRRTMVELTKSEIDELARLPIADNKEIGVWLEKTYVKGIERRAGEIYSLGKTLWSPQRDTKNADIYKNMREVKPGDLVLHLVNNSDIVGISKVSSELITNFYCESGSEWDNGTGKRPGYLLRLDHFIQFEIPINRRDILNEKNKSQLLNILDRYHDVFYNKTLNLRQGAYLTKVPSPLLEIINDKYKQKNNVDLPYLPEIKRIWVFQANPEWFDLISALESLDKLTWPVVQSKKQIHVGDIVYLWISGPEAGIYAVSTIITEPLPIPINENERAFLKAPEKLEPVELRVQLRIDKVLEKPILRRDLLTHSVLQKMGVITFPNATNYLLKPLEVDVLGKMIKGGIFPPSYTIGDFAKETGFDRNEIERWERILRRKKHIVFQGPPGTGKTYVAEHLAKLFVSGTGGFVDTVQFHPAYTYEDFVQGIRPKPSEGSLDFRLEKGRFLEFCEKAKETVEEDPCVLIIDEINRAHLARVFGELMYMLEYRDNAIPLAAGGEPFKIPENVYIIGTMNTADRSIALVDHALRRRFSFIRLEPNYSVLKGHLEVYSYPVDSLINVLKGINAAIDDRNYELGISFFLKDRDKLKEMLPEIWETEIEPYLEEFFYDQPGKVGPFRWSNLIENELKDWVE